VATQALSGNGGQVKAAGTVNEVSAWTASYTTDVSDVTSFDSSGFVEKIPTLVHFDGNFVAQAFNNKKGLQSSGVFRTDRSSVSSSKPSFSGKFIITNMTPNVTAAPGEAITWNYDFESTGPVSVNVS
jgi:hypothetical protein